MNTTRAFQMATRMGQDLLDYGPDHSRLLVRMTRLLAEGHPVETGQVDKIIADLRIGQDEGNAFLRCITERDAGDRVVGIAGLSLNDHPHRFVVNGVPLTSWCAEDTLFLPSMLKQTATVESVSPLSKELIHVTVSPQQVDSVSPADAVLSIVIVSPTEQHMASVEAIWSRAVGRRPRRYRNCHRPTKRFSLASSCGRVYLRMQSEKQCVLHEARVDCESRTGHGTEAASGLTDLCRK